MASFYLRTSTQLASAKRGAAHSDYISGHGKYAEKNEVVFLLEKNIPSFAENAKEFFSLADELERANGRSFRTVVFAIPFEATDKNKWATDFVNAMLANDCPYQLAVHDLDGNPHCHLMFCERDSKFKCPMRDGKIDKKAFFSRKNPKFEFIKTKEWLTETKAVYLEHIRLVAPDYTPALRSEPKIGPKLKFAGESYEVARAAREHNVKWLRLAQKYVSMAGEKVKILDAQIAKLIQQERFEMVTRLKALQEIHSEALNAFLEAFDSMRKGKPTEEEGKGKSSGMGSVMQFKPTYKPFLKYRPRRKLRVQKKAIMPDDLLKLNARITASHRDKGSRFNEIVERATVPPSYQIPNAPRYGKK